MFEKCNEIRCLGFSDFLTSFYGFIYLKAIDLTNLPLPPYNVLTIQ